MWGHDEADLSNRFFSATPSSPKWSSKPQYTTLKSIGSQNNNLVALLNISERELYLMYSLYVPITLILIAAYTQKLQHTLTIDYNLETTIPVHLLHKFRAKTHFLHFHQIQTIHQLKQNYNKCYHFKYLGCL